jgi:hypothetical protein
MDVGSKTYDGVRFSAWVDDHIPPHVHAFYAGIEVVIELAEGEFRVADRKDAITPR